MQDIASILPNVLRKSGFGRKIRETEILELFEKIADESLPGDVRGSVRAMSVQGSLLLVASLSGFATRELKRQEGYILAKIKGKLVNSKISKIRFLA